MGRHPVPTEVLKRKKGVLYSDQRDRAALEPRAEREIRPRCPRDFTPAERRAWKDYARLADSYGLFQGGNAGLLKRIATASVLYDRLRKDYIDTMLPKVGAAMLSVGRDISAMEEKLGLPSVSRAKIGSLMLKAKKEKDEFFND